MPIIRTIYRGGLRTGNEHLLSGNKIMTDVPPDNQGKGEYFSSTDLLATAPGSCNMTIMGIKARDFGINLTGTVVDVAKIMAFRKRRVAGVIVDFNFPDEGYTYEGKKLVGSLAGTGPVPLSLHPDLIQAIRFHW